MKRDKYKKRIKGEQTMRDQILEILTDIRPDIDFEKETKLIDDKILDRPSIDIIKNG
jgi:hypothetical protein